MGEILLNNILAAPKETPEPVVGDDPGKIVHVVSPWGELIATYFTAEQWSMLETVAELSKQPLDEVIVQTVAERYKHEKGSEE